MPKPIPCRCGGYPFPHRSGGGPWCIHGNDPTPEDMTARYGGHPSDYGADSIMPNAIRPMLALRSDKAGELKFPYLVQPKLDGIRALVVFGQFQSRSGEPIANRRLQQLLKDDPRLASLLEGTDGELVVGNPRDPDSYRRTSSVVNSHLAALDDLRFYAFDFWKSNGGARERYAFLIDIQRNLSSPAHDWIYFLPHDLVEDQGQLEELEVAAVAAGFEGIVARHANAPYHNGRAGKRLHQLLKFKRFEDTELKVIDYEEQRTHVGEQETSELGYAKRGRRAEDMAGAGVLGALVCRWGEDTVRVGTGFSAADRQQLWDNRGELIGLIAKVRYMPHGTHEKPRHPSFLGFRAASDMGE